MTTTSRLNGFMAAASAQLLRDDSKIADHIGTALAAGYAGPRALPPASMPACAILDSMLSNAEEDHIQKLAACAEDLHWRMAGFGKLSGEINNKLAVAELIGPDGLFVRPDIRIGLLLQREGFHYPNHSHAAEEIYLVLSGTAMWAVDNAEPIPRGPGGIIRHRSYQPHSIETIGEPLCALWGWVGDVAGGSYSV
ncbi:MAG: dimethylsulfonioproprionate lyase family protein [Paracoccaceae bacterium]|nr:dimethylsulfonioproprionate lyase family protein [Paracoccaceae bacterium]